MAKKTTPAPETTEAETTATAAETTATVTETTTTEAGDRPLPRMGLLDRAMAMAYHNEGQDVLTDFSDIEPVLVRFFQDNPDAPAEAGLMQVKISTGSELVLVHAPVARVRLAVDLLKAAVLGMARIERDEMAEMDAATTPALPQSAVDPEEGAYAREDGGLLAPSELGKSPALATVPQG